MSFHLIPRTCSAGCKKWRCLSINRMWFGLRLFRGTETRGKQSEGVTATEDGKRGNKWEGDTVKLANNEATTSVSWGGFWAENQGCWAVVKPWSDPRLLIRYIYIMVYIRPTGFCSFVSLLLVYCDKYLCAGEWQHKTISSLIFHDNGFMIFPIELSNTRSVWSHKSIWYLTPRCQKTHKVIPANENDNRTACECLAPWFIYWLLYLFVCLCL